MKIGILGGGQLAQMMAKAGQSMGHEFLFVSPSLDAHTTVGPYGELLNVRYDDEQALKHLSAWADVVTFDFENVPLASLQFLQNDVAVYPSPLALSVASDRFKEKSRFRELGLRTAEFGTIDSFEDLSRQVEKVGLPAIIKTRFEGYDGKGQAVINDLSELTQIWQKFSHVPCIIESMVAFKRELSIIAARNLKGEIVFYPLTENYHRKGMLRLSISLLDDPLQATAEKMIQAVLDNLNYVGVLAMELFQVGEALYVNEIAPRVHNSGHWTIEGAQTSQFKNHLLAICNQPLGDSNIIHTAAMVNLIGFLPAEAAITAVPGAVLHCYNKQPIQDRKLGHITLLDEDAKPEVFKQRLVQLLMLAGETDLAKQKFLIS